MGRPLMGRVLVPPIQRKLLVLIAAFALAVLRPAHAGERQWFRDELARSESVANDRESVMRVELARGVGYYLGDVPATGIDPRSDPRTYVIVDVGYINPVLVFLNRAPEPRPDPGYTSGQQAIQISVPVAFHVFWDPFTNEYSNPIINTDYEFGLDVSVRRGIGRMRELRFGGYVGHISTHIGDEYVIHGRDDPTFPFARINVSYEPWRLNGSFRQFVGKDADHPGFFSYWQLMAQVEGSSWHGGDGGRYYVVCDGRAEGGSGRGSWSVALALRQRASRGSEPEERVSAGGWAVSHERWGEWVGTDDGASALVSCAIALYFYC